MRAAWKYTMGKTSLPNISAREVIESVRNLISEKNDVCHEGEIQFHKLNHFLRIEFGLMFNNGKGLKKFYDENREVTVTSVLRGMKLAGIKNPHEMQTNEYVIHHASETLIHQYYQRKLRFKVLEKQEIQ